MDGMRKIRFEHGFYSDMAKSNVKYDNVYLFLLSVPASLLDLMPEDVELVSISIFFNIEFVSGPESHGLVLIRLRCRGDGATSATNQRQRENE